MRTQSTFSVLFWIYSKRAKENQTAIYARISINGRKLNISLKRKVDVDLWDPKKQKLMGKSPYAKELNQFLEQERSTLFQCYQDLRMEGAVISAETIKSRYFGDRDHLFSLEDIFEYHNNNMFSKLKRNTTRLYITSQNYIRGFVQKVYGRKDLYLKELDYSFVVKFENYLRAVKPRHYRKNLQHNAVMKHIQRLRKMITLAYHLDWIEKDPFVKFKPHLERSERGFLTPEELEGIELVKLEIPRLKKVRDLFIFSCYTGISFGDLILLTPQNLVIGIDKKFWIITRREKNGNQVKVPLLAKAMNLLEEYRNNEECQIKNSLLPTITNQKANSYLKEIAAKCGVKKNLTFHLARHTFATTVALSNGVPIETVSKILGHKKLSTTQIYAKVIERKVGEDMELLQQKLNKPDEGGGINSSRKSN
jgi:site-specific recombinase XerD